MTHLPVTPPPVHVIVAEAPRAPEDNRHGYNLRQFMLSLIATEFSAQNMEILFSQGFFLLLLLFLLAPIGKNILGIRY